MRPSRPLAVATTLVGIVVALPGASAAPPPFRLTEATIAQTQQPMAAGRLTCRQLVEGYLARISAYDRKGPALQSVIAVSNTAIKDAIALDKVKSQVGQV